MEVMLDLETMGDSYAAPIASIGALLYDPKVADTAESLTADESRLFYNIVDLKSQGPKEFSYSARTIYWWLSQSAQAREEIIPRESKTVYSIKEALHNFKDWYAKHSAGQPLDVFSYGATFDHVILQHAYNVTRIGNPIPYKHQLCMRTVAKLDKIPCPSTNGVPHKAIDDCIRQTLWMQAIRQNNGKA